MSLFPAYDEDKGIVEKNTKEVTEDSAGPSWLSYPCYALANKISSTSSDDDNKSLKLEESSERKKRKKKKVKKDRKKHKRKESGSDDNSSSLFIIDESGIEHAKNTIKQPTGPIVKQIELTKPVYSGVVAKPIKKKKKKKKKQSRYFTENKVENEIEDLNERPTLSVEEFINKTEEFNIRLRNEPNDVSLWMDYVRLQDLGIGTKIGKAEKKLSILRKALENNGCSEELLNERMMIYEAIHPFEKVSTEAKSLLTKYPNNPVGWRWLIQSVQFSLSKMTAPGVLQAYEQVLEGLHRSRQHNTPVFLDTLLQCLLFLRQAGLWEQLWLLSELYLELTYTTAGSGAFKINVNIPEKDIQNLEDTVLTSGLTLGALWLRTEHLRECVHFFPVLDSPDPQRTVFVDDLSGLLFPLGSATYSRVMCYILVAFKVPPLSMTDNFYNFVGLNSIPWSLDNIELLLTGCSRNRGIVKLDATYLESCRELLTGPQYLNRERLGAKQFFESVDCLFNSCVNHCAEEDIPSLLAWQVRWWTYVVQHSFYNGEQQQQQLMELSKELRGKAKILLKKFRQCLPLYTEYAVYEAQVGNFDISKKVLETAIDLQQPPLIAGRDRRDICSMYKTFVELLLQNSFTDHREQVLKVLIAMAFGEPVRKISPTEDLTIKALERMSHIATEYIREFETNNDNISYDISSLKDVALPHEAVCWLSCYSWFLYICKDVWQSCAQLEKAINILEETSFIKHQTIGRCIMESLFETMLSIMNHFCTTKSSQYQVLQEMINRAIKHFPNNTYFLHLFATSTKFTTAKWQKVLTNVLSTKSPLASVILVFILRNKLLTEEYQQLVSMDNAHKRISTLLNKLTKESFTERCPLVWRLMLQSSDTLSMMEIKKILFLALEKCPWVKMLYFEAAKMLPEDMAQIQDLLVEKELRLHITPEELEILREN